MPGDEGVTTLGQADAESLGALLARFGLELVLLAEEAAIPGSFWGAPEAGLVGTRVYARRDTPVHSVLHESCHFVCMRPARRARLHTNAGGDYDEENCVCYLQIVLADYLAGFGRRRMMDDMDRWGYSFRLGSARAWFERDAADALVRLRSWRVLNHDGCPAWRLRGESNDNDTFERRRA